MIDGVCWSIIEMQTGPHESLTASGRDVFK